MSDVNDQLAHLIRAVNDIAKPPAAAYLTAREAATYLGMSYGAFRNEAKHIRRCAGINRYTRPALDAFAQTRRKRK